MDPSRNPATVAPEALEAALADARRERDALQRRIDLEEALDHVRARTMAMHRSNELREVVGVLFEQIQPLGFESFGCSIIICDEEGGMEIWYASDTHTILPESYYLPLLDHPYYEKQWNAWKEGVSYTTFESSGDLKRSWDRLVLEETDLKKLPEAIKARYSALEKIFGSLASMPHGLLAAWSYMEPLPDYQAAILQRFARVFEQTYTRFLDLKKAEAQAREAQIEAALERVRAKAMAMHTSEDLAATISVVFHELKTLQIAPMRCGVGLIDETRRCELFTSTTTEQGEALDLVATVQLEAHPVYESIFDHWERQQELHLVLQGEDLRSYYRRLKPEFDVPDWQTAGIQYGHFFYFPEGGLYAWSDQDFEEEERHVFRKFTTVLGLTYRRYLDLKEAEAQAREAQIEAALERVRARAMAMHRSEELGGAAVLLYEELKTLGITPFFNCGYVEVDEGQEIQHVWMASPDGSAFEGHTLPLVGDAVLQLRYEAWKRQDPVFQQALHGDQRTKHIDFASPYLGSAEWEETLRTQWPDPTIFYCCNFPHGYLHIITDTLLSVEEEALLVRFTRVFEQTYTRFLDLKKAEAQARESEVQLALERVRARTMAMHASDELSETSLVLLQQIESLGIKMGGCSFNVWLPQEASAEAWTSNPAGEIVHSIEIPHTEDPTLQRIYTAWEKGASFYEEAIGGEALEEHFRYMMSVVPDAEAIAQGIEEAGFPFPEFAVFNAAYYAKGYLLFITLEPYPDARDIFERFARVFEQTYTRFLDLKKAEEQAREAQIEAALERVRARAMAMHHSDELREVVAGVFEGFQRLDFSSPTCCIGIFEKASRASEWWVASASEVIMLRSYRIPYLEGWPQDWYQMVYNNWQQGVPFFECVLEGEDKRAFDHKMEYETEFGLIGDSSFLDVVPLENMILSYATLTHGVLEVGTTEPLTEDEVHILQRFGSVIDLTYTRFDDLKQAEARAREAVREASLDRVRAEIASMRTADDLQRITPLIWRELTTLGVPFFRCGVFIIDEAAQITHTYLSTPDGTSLAALHLPFESTPLVAETVDHWRRRQVYTNQWDQEQFAAWVAALVEQGHLDATQAYQGGDVPPEVLALHFLPFTQGMLYVGSSTPLSDEEIDLGQALADAFSVAYARYEDFTKLEAAKARVEATLTDLKATQTQLIHAEKMASLGEMTAGIAHEIKNPLNFVNNFADLNEEIAQELTDELTKFEAHLPGEAVEDFKDALATMQTNAAQIAKHGRRADDIVKSMMQHAREGTGLKEPAAINALVEEYVNLAFHGLRASQPGFTAEIERDYSEAVGQASVLSQELGRVLMNLLSNAFYAVDEHAARSADGYTPTVTVATKVVEAGIEIRVCDNGPGIPAEVQAKIFEPFFTTKPTGSGTGLGLSLSYDIVTKGHGGTLAVESAVGEGATFVVTLPVKAEGRMPMNADRI